MVAGSRFEGVRVSFPALPSMAIRTSPTQSVNGGLSPVTLNPNPARCVVGVLAETESGTLNGRWRQHAVKYRSTVSVLGGLAGSVITRYRVLFHTALLMRIGAELVPVPQHSVICILDSAKCRELLLYTHLLRGYSFQRGPVLVAIFFLDTVLMKCCFVKLIESIIFILAELSVFTCLLIRIYYLGSLKR